MNKTKLPEYDWAVQEDGSIKVTTEVRPKEVLLWQCTNAETRDFRIETTGKTWTSTRLRSAKRGTYVGRVPEPEKGWPACQVELTYAAPLYIDVECTKYRQPASDASTATGVAPASRTISG